MILFAAGHWADMNARIKYNLGMAKRNAYFRSERKTFYEKRDYKTGVSGKRISETELAAIQEKVAKTREEDNKLLTRHILITIVILLVVVGMSIYFFRYYFS